jgi:NAD(P)-dependent dehydrogenase (short-subunit alcohol dehydrogenase family)
MSWAVVTGAGSGIGAVIARHAAEAGYRVAVWDIDGDAAGVVAAQIGGGATGTRVDVADETSVVAALAALDGPPALVVNNAGIVRFGPLATLSLADWNAVLAVNLTGAFVVARSAAAVMVDGGSIVNIASVNGIAAAPNAGAYTSAKAALIMLTEQMALEWADRAIRVNAVAPGLLFLASARAGYITAQTLTVDGGLTKSAMAGLARPQSVYTGAGSGS